MDKFNMYTDEGTYVQIPVCEKTISQELSTDFTLPDYQPEIKRLLRINASILPPSGYFGASDAEFSGNIDYYVLYIGSDGEIYCAPLSSEYTVNVPIDCDDIGAGFDGNAQIFADSISGRVTGPRKLSIRSRLKAMTHVYNNLPLGTNFGSDMDPSAVERLESEVKVAKIIYSAGETFHVTDEIIPDSRAKEIRVICAEGKVMINEVNAGNNDIVCRGDVHLKVMMCRENDGENDSEKRTFCISRKIPFSQNIPADGVTAEADCCAYGTVTELSVDVEEGRIGVDVGLVIETLSGKNQNVKYTKDMYSTVCESNAEYKKLLTPKSIGSFNGNFTLSDSISLEDAGINPASSIVDSTGNAYIEEYSYENGKCTMSGKAKFNLQLQRADEYSVSEIEFPFKYTVNFKDNSSFDKYDINCRAEVISTRSRIDTERIGIDAEIAVCGSSMAIEEVTTLSTVHFGEGIKANRGEYVVCFPSADDTLWSVAKRYRSHISTITDENQLSNNYSSDSESSLSGVSYLLV